MIPPQTPPSLTPRAFRRLERTTRDLDAQLDHARSRQEYIQRRLQKRLLQADTEQRELKTKFAELRIERERLQRSLAEAERKEMGCRERLRASERERSRLATELQGIYASLSWRITSPLRSIKAFLVSRERSER